MFVFGHTIFRLNGNRPLFEGNQPNGNRGLSDSRENRRVESVVRGRLVVIARSTFSRVRNNQSIEEVEIAMFKAFTTTTKKGF